jgi:hypothetical protein
MGNVTIVGKRFSKIKKEELTPSELVQRGKQGEIGSCIFKRLDRFVELGLKMMEQEPKNDIQDSYYNLGARIHLQALVAGNERNKIEGRLEAAIEVGIIYQLIKTYKIESITNSPNSAGNREWPELDKWVIDLISKEKTHQEIWDELPSNDQAEYGFYKDGDNLYFESDGEITRKKISKNHFIKTKVSEIKKRYKMPPL